MSVLKVKNNGVWENVGTPLISDADTLDGKHADEFALASDVETLQTQVGDSSVSEQIDTALQEFSSTELGDGAITPEKLDRGYWQKRERIPVTSYDSLDVILEEEVAEDTIYRVEFSGLSPVKSVVGEGNFAAIVRGDKSGLYLFNITTGKGWIYEKGSNEIIACQSQTNYVTPQMFGAKADGTTDDTQAIQSAMNSDKEVFFPEGNYKITSSIVIPYNCTIKGTNDSIVIGNSNIDGFTISADEVFIENITITDCDNAINLNGNKNVFSRVHVKNSKVGCYINSTRSWGNNFNNCRFEYNVIGIESTIINTSSFTDCKIAFNTNFGVKANLKFVKFEGGYIEANGADWDSTNKTYIERLDTAGIYLPNDASHPSNSVYFIGVDFENNGETSIRHDNQGGASDFIFIGGQFVVSNHTNVRSAIWINVYGHCIRWTFYGTKFPEGSDTIYRQIAGKEDADESDSTRKPTRFTTNRTWDSNNANVLQYATIDGNYQGYDTDYVTKAEKERWNAKPTTEQMNTAIEAAIGEGVTMDVVNEAIEAAIFSAIEGEY